MTLQCNVAVSVESDRRQTMRSMLPEAVSDIANTFRDRWERRKVLLGPPAEWCHYSLALGQKATNRLPPWFSSIASPALWLEPHRTPTCEDQIPLVCEILNETWRPFLENARRPCVPVFDQDLSTALLIHRIFRGDVIMKIENEFAYFLNTIEGTVFNFCQPDNVKSKASHIQAFQIIHLPAWHSTVWAREREAERQLREISFRFVLVAAGLAVALSEIHQKLEEYRDRARTEKMDDS